MWMFQRLALTTLHTWGDAERDMPGLRPAVSWRVLLFRCSDLGMRLF